ncbi:MAG: hypothetical protein COV46_06920 [Deltaproteobacteria bacterium CG11_big_fil_rev_8_21_14_0_20_49_13]|nr:MAG: hypothetical protein COV46_06920 [Deltaproteobacteria bacterium CG11_big_fil_rev_8_21_14_0_20_49_13]
MKVRFFPILLLVSSCFVFQAAYAADKTTGSITGEIKLEGKRPPKKAAPAIVEYQGPCGTRRSTEIVRLWKNRITDVTLWLTREKGSGPNLLSGTPAAVGQSCEFMPKMLPAVPGSIVRVINNDPYTQWLLVEEEGFKKRQIMQEPEGEPVELEVKKGKVIHLSSGFYPWMEAWIRPVPKLFAVAATKWDGLFEFNDIPPGKYTIHAWHSSLGETSEEVIVEAGEKDKVEIAFQLPLESPIPVMNASSLENFLSGSTYRDADENPFKK